jgi:hypothetical protein
MKAILLAGTMLAVLSCPSALANDDPSEQASALGACGALSAIATPVMITGSGVCLAAGTANGLVKVVDSAGKGLAELTFESFEAVLSSSYDTPNRVTIKKKEIPLVVRKDYLELNEKVKTQ